MYAHVVLWFKSSGIILPRSIVVSNWIYTFHMPLMFMISGYVQGMKSYSSQRWLQWVKKSAVSIYLPCMIFSLTQWCIMYFVFSRNNPANFGALEAGDLLMIPLAGFKEYWFLAALFFIKVIHSAFECRGVNEYVHLAFWVIVFVLPVPRLSFGLYFHAGYILRTRGYISLTKQPKFLHGLLLFMAGVASFVFMESSRLTSAIASISQSLGLVMMFYAYGKGNSVLAVYGAYSMVVYCLHNWVTACFRMVFAVSGMVSSAEPFMMFAVSFVAAMVIPLVVVWLYENVKCLRWVEFIFYPGRLWK